MYTTTITAQSPINNQGLIFFTTQNATSFTMSISPDKSDPKLSIYERYFCLKVNGSKASFAVKLRDPYSRRSTSREVTSEENENVAIANGVLVTYWLSFSHSYDEQKKKFIPELKYGKGFAMEKTILMQATLDEIDCKELFSYSTTKYVKVVQIDADDDDYTGIEPYLYINKIPHTFDPSPFITNSETATLMDISRGTSLSSMLPKKIRTLFETVKDLELDPVLAKAIGYSLKTEGKLLYEFVENKRNDDGGFDDCHIRVTMGHDVRHGVGMPFLLEIWPSTMGSTIHNDKDAAAVIKVLHGEINITTYNKLVSPPQTIAEIEENPLKTFDCKKGDVTWRTKNYFQVHKLKNNTEDYCATIQCYLYDGGDRIHYPDFDFVAEEGDVPQHERFYPDADFAYHELYYQLVSTYHTHLKEDYASSRGKAFGKLLPAVRDRKKEDHASRGKAFGKLLPAVKDRIKEDYASSAVEERAVEEAAEKEVAAEEEVAEEEIAAEEDVAGEDVAAEEEVAEEEIAAEEED